MKYGPQLNIKNFARFVMFSNHTAPIDLEDGDRRYFVFNSEAQPRDSDYYDALNKCISSVDGMNSIYTWLMQRDISRFRPYAAPPVTEAKRKVIETSGNPLKHYLAEVVLNGYVYEALGMEFTIDALQRLLHKDGFGQQAKNLKELRSALHDAGVVEVRKNVNGVRTRVRRLPVSDANKCQGNF